jgi:sugar lactone lactonase YvrE
VVHLAGSDGASKDPELQRLVRFGGSAVCCGLAVDSQSNIYVGIKEGWGTEVANVILVKEDQVVQLPMEVEEMEGIAVAPDGQILYIWDGEGNVLRWEQPWAAVDGQVVATVEEYGIFRCVADGTG